MYRTAFGFGPRASCLVVLVALSCAAGQKEAKTPTSATVQPEEDPHLVEFSLANCLFWHFREQGWPTEDIRNIAGGYVEMGTQPAEAYERLASFIRDYEPKVATKHPVNPHLLRCFHLRESAKWRELVAPSTEQGARSAVQPNNRLHLAGGQ